MQDTQSILERVQELVVHLDYTDRLAIIRAIATVEPPPTVVEPELDESDRALAAEQAAWFAQPAGKRRRYGEDYVAVYHGEVVDHDPDQRSLYLRVRARYGRIPVLIVPAKWNQPPVYVFHSTQLER